MGYWEAVILFVVYFILRWFRSLRGIAVIVLASSCVSIFSEMLSSYGRLYVRLLVWNTVWLISRVVDIDTISGFNERWYGMLICLFFLYSMPLNIACLPFALPILICALINYGRSGNDSSMFIFWFNIGKWLLVMFELSARNTEVPRGILRIRYDAEDVEVGKIDLFEEVDVSKHHHPSLRMISRTK